MPPPCVPTRCSNFEQFSASLLLSISGDFKSASFFLLGPRSLSRSRNNSVARAEAQTNAEELDKTLHPDAVSLVGVNNRNLHDFSVSLDTSGELAQRIPTNYVKVTESGLSSAANIEALRAVGYRGFLIGETFMRQSRPEKACAALVQQLRATEVVTLL